MHCLKCGSEISESAVFCDNCLKRMEQSPVKQGTVVQLLERPALPDRKVPKRRDDPRETIVQQRKLIRALMSGVAILTALSLLLIGILIYFVNVFF